MYLLSRHCVKLNIDPETIKREELTMSRISRPKGMGSARSSTTGKATGRGTQKTSSSQPAEAYYYGTDMPGGHTSGQVHIVIPDLFVGSRLAQTINVQIGESIQVGPRQGGMMVTGVQVGKLDPKRFTGNVQGKGIGQIIVGVDQSSKHSPETIVEVLRSHYLPGVEIGEVKQVGRAADLPGESTGPGVGDLPGKPRPRQSTSGPRSPSASTAGESATKKKSRKKKKKDEEQANDEQET